MLELGAILLLVVLADRANERPPMQSRLEVTESKKQHWRRDDGMAF